MSETSATPSSIAVSDNPIISGPIWRQLLYFFFPILLGTFFQQLYNTADAVIVGNFVGKEALAAVGGTTNVLISFLVNLFVGVSSGTTVVIAQHYGAQRFEDVHKTVHTSMALAVAAGIGITVLGLLFSRPALEAMGTPDDIIGHALTYMRIYFLGTVASFIYNMGSGILRAVGDTKRPLYFLIAACLVNIVLDLVFVMFLDWGVAGVGLATILSQIIAAILVVLALTSDGGPHHLDTREIRFYSNDLKSILKVGLPAGIQSDMYTISNILIQSCINSFGTNTVAAWTAFGKVDGFYWMISGAYCIAITTFVGQNFGAGKYERIRKATKVCLGMIFGTTILISLLFCTFGQPLLSMFTQDAEVLQIGMQIMMLQAPFYVTFIFIEVLSGTIRGTGDSFFPMVITCTGVCVLRILWVIFVLPLRHQFSTLIIGYPITWIITSLMFLLYYWKGGWMERAIKRQNASL